MRIIEQPRIDRSAVGYSTEYYCVNGIVGVTKEEYGLRKILLHLAGDTYEYGFYFESREGDATAAAIMQTFHTRASRRCPG
jgi:hypothetical protein